MVPRLRQSGPSTTPLPDQPECQPRVQVPLGRCYSSPPLRAKFPARVSPSCRHWEVRELARSCCTPREFRFLEFVSIVGSWREAPVICPDSEQRLSVGDRPLHSHCV